MRYFYAILFFLGVTVIGVAGFRGAFSRRPPVELFADMVRQPKVRPQSAASISSDERSSSQSAAETKVSVPRTRARQIGTNSIYPFEDSPINTGREPGKTNFVEISPLPFTRALLDRGQLRFDIYCSPCHGPSGDGRGVGTRYGVIPANFHDKRLIEMTDGQIFKTITKGGVTLMGPYESLVGVEDRWAIIGYIRALQRSQIATTNDVPEQVRATLK